MNPLVAGALQGLHRLNGRFDARSGEHAAELQARRDLHSFPTRRSSDAVSLHTARALMPKPSDESARRWRLAGTRSPQCPLRCRTAPAIASVAPTLSDLHGARRTLRNMRDRD